MKKAFEGEDLLKQGMIQNETLSKQKKLQYERKYKIIKCDKFLAKLFKTWLKVLRKLYL